MEVILLQNTIIRQRRFQAGDKVVVDEVIGRYLIEHDLACEVPGLEAEPVTVKKTKKKVKSS